MGGRSLSEDCALGLRGPGVLVELRLRGSLICVALGATCMRLGKGACCVNNNGKCLLCKQQRKAVNASGC